MKTVLLFNRRLGNVRHAIEIEHLLFFFFRRILVLEAGRVIEYGHTQVLLTNKKSELYQLAKEAGLTWDSVNADDEHQANGKDL